MTKEEEIVGVLTGKLYEERWETLNDGKRSVADTQFEIGKSLSISKADIYDYVQKNGFPSGLFRTKPGFPDGDYFVQLDNGKYALYGQERGCRFNEKVCDTYEEAVKSSIDDITRYYFNKPDERIADAE